MRQVSQRMNHPISEFAIFMIGSSQEEGGRRVRGVGARRVSRSRFSLQVRRDLGRRSFRHRAKPFSEGVGGFAIQIDTKPCLGSTRRYHMFVGTPLKKRGKNM